MNRELHSNIYKEHIVITYMNFKLITNTGYSDTVTGG
jgi:hypothetical protein